MRHIRVWAILLAGACYVLVGTGTAALAGHASSSVGVKTWRFAAWLLSLGVFVIHFITERRRSERLKVASSVAFGVALGALGAAALGPVRAHWAEPTRTKLVLLSLIAWPIVTGVPAFVVAFVGASIFGRTSIGLHQANSRVAAEAPR
jgi:hypothetical protein